MRTNQEHPFLGFPAGFRKIGAFSGQIGLSHRYESCSSHRDIYSCQIWEFLEMDFPASRGDRPHSEEKPEVPRRAESKTVIRFPNL